MHDSEPDVNGKYADKYQVMRNHLPVCITELSRDELIKELALAMDALESLDTIQYKSGDVIDAWRAGRPIVDYR